MLASGIGVPNVAVGKAIGYSWRYRVNRRYRGAIIRSDSPGKLQEERLVNHDA